MEGAYAIAYNNDEENPNPHTLDVYRERFATFDEAFAEAERRQHDEDDGAGDTPFLIVCLHD